MRRWLAALVLVVAWPSMAHATTYYVTKAGHDTTGNGSAATPWLTITKCASVAVAGDLCSIGAGTYDEHVTTVNAGTSDSARITYLASGTVTMKGFEIRHPYITVQGFDITGATLTDLVYVTATGDYCKLISNTIRDGGASIYGVLFDVYGGMTNCEITNNTFSNLAHINLVLTGSSHTVSGNTFTLQNNDFIRLFASNTTIRRNIFYATADAAAGGHQDIIQTWGDPAWSITDNVFEENWVESLVVQIGNLTSAGGSITDALSPDPDVHSLTFRRNVFINTNYNVNVYMRNTHFENNTFYWTFKSLSGIIGSSCYHIGDGSEMYVSSNVFLAGGTTTNSGFYSFGRAYLTATTLDAFATHEGVYPGTIAGDAFADLIERGYLDYTAPYGFPSATAHALSSITEFAMDSPTFDAYKTAIYNTLIATVALDDSIQSTRYADYNYVAGYPASGYPAKSTSGCVPGGFYEGSFCEDAAYGKHGVNGGNPLLKAGGALTAGILAIVPFTGGGYVPSTKTLTKVGAFAGYTPAVGDEIEISWGNESEVGRYPVASKTNNDTLVLGTATWGGVTEVRPYDVSGSPVTPRSVLLGADGIPLTIDDGLKPTAASTLLCGKGLGGVDIGAYSCDPAVVFAGSAALPAAPTNVRVR